MSAAPDLINFSRQELSFLKNCSPLKHFEDGAFHSAILSAKTGSLTPEAILFEGRQHENIGYDLLSGKVKTFDRSGQCFELPGDSLESFYPVTAHIDARVKCVVTSNVRYAAISMDDLANIAMQASTFDVVEISDELTAVLGSLEV